MSRPRDRVSAEGLLPRMEARQWRDSDRVTYRYKTFDGKWVNLGTDKTAALRKVLDMNGQSPHHGSVRWLWEQWQTSKRCLRLTDGTRADYALAWRQIEPHFGALPAAAITAPLVAQYIHIKRAGSPRRADIEKAVLSNLFKHGILLGVCQANPTVGVEPHGSEPERKMPNELALRAFLSWLGAQTPQRRVIGLMAEYAALTGNRRIEFLDLAWTQVDEKAGEIRVFRAKQRGKKRDRVVEVIGISPRLSALLQRVRALDREGLYLFPSRDGGPYTTEGFETLWQRCMTQAIEDGVLKPADRFNFHALRHYFTTMHKAERGHLPNLHPNPNVTARIYDETIEERRASL